MQGKDCMLDPKNNSVHNWEEDSPLHDPNVRIGQGVAAGLGRRPAIPRWSPHFRGELALAADGLEGVDDEDDDDEVRDREQPDDETIDDAPFLDEALEHQADVDCVSVVSMLNRMVLSHPDI